MCLALPMALLAGVDKAGLACGEESLAMTVEAAKIRQGGKS